LIKVASFLASQDAGDYFAFQGIKIPSYNIFRTSGSLKKFHRNALFCRTSVILFAEFCKVASFYAMTKIMVTLRFKGLKSLATIYPEPPVLLKSSVGTHYFVGLDFSNLFAKFCKVASFFAMTKIMVTLPFKGLKSSATRCPKLPFLLKSSVGTHYFVGLDFSPV
jgi:hypothetical protein